jgi:hypothetical protein
LRNNQGIVVGESVIKNVASKESLEVVEWMWGDSPFPGCARLDDLHSGSEETLGTKEKEEDQKASKCD